MGSIGAFLSNFFSVDNPLFFDQKTAEPTDLAIASAELSDTINKNVQRQYGDAWNKFWTWLTKYFWYFVFFVLMVLGVLLFFKFKK